MNESRKNGEETMFDNVENAKNVQNLVENTNLQIQGIHWTQARYIQIKP